MTRNHLLVGLGADLDADKARLVELDSVRGVTVSIGVVKVSQAAQQHVDTAFDDADGGVDLAPQVGAAGGFVVDGKGNGVDARQVRAGAVREVSLEGDEPLLGGESGGCAEDSKEQEPCHRFVAEMTTCLGDHGSILRV